MKVFWFTNIVLPNLARSLGRQPPVVGGWMSSLLELLSARADVEIAVACFDEEVQSLERYFVDGVTYFLLPPISTHSLRMSPSFADACSAAITSFKPDIIHVHGTENPYGLYTAAGSEVPPSVVSIQGLMHACCRHVRGGISLRLALDGRFPGLLCWLRYGLQEAQWSRRGQVETNIIRSNRNFIGRTAWDRARVLAINPTANYFHAEELMRPEFYNLRWQRTMVRKHTVFCTAAHSPLKGFHWLLYAIARLRSEFPDINVRVADAPWGECAGRGFYGRYLKALIDKHSLAPHVTALPALSATAVAQELLAAHVFVIPSLMENSPNSLAEAMLVGTPCIASAVGGIPSMVSNGREALCFPAGDVSGLTDCIRKVFGDDALAVRLSESGRATAQARHRLDAIVDRQMEVYRQVMATGR